MTTFRDTPVYNDSLEDMLEKHNIEKLLQYERYCRDDFLFDEMEKCYASDASLRVTWYNGTGKQYVDLARKQGQKPDNSVGSALYRGPKHKVHNTFIWLNQDKTKAVAEMQTLMLAMKDIKGHIYYRGGWGRLLYKVKKEDGVWKIYGMDCIYERDFLIPAKPDYSFDTSIDFSKYRKSYQCISYLFDKRGTENNNDLPGDDRPELIEALYKEADEWLYA